LGKSELASSWYRAQLAASPGHEQALAGLQRQLLGRGDIDGLLELAHQLAGQGNAEAAERLGRAAYEADRGRGTTALLLGMLTAAEDGAMAAALLRRGLAETPSHAGGLAGLARALAAFGRGTSASIQALRVVAASS